MGTNVGCSYATIYFAYHEQTVILKLPFITFYRRLIDDAFVIIEDSRVNFDCLESAMNDYGPPGKRLHWKPEQQGPKVHFLDLWVSISPNHRLETSTYQKPVNMYLYRCPSSAQPPSTLFGLIYSTLHRYYWHNTHWALSPVYYFSIFTSCSITNYIWQKFQPTRLTILKESSTLFA